MLIEVKIEGVSPLLMNRFTDAAALAVSAGISSAIQGSKPPPRDQADVKVYKDSNGKPVIPSPNLMACLVDAGKFIKAGKSKISTTRSSLVPAGITIPEIELPITPQKWECDSRAVVVPATGGRIMAHRPRFDEWALKFTLDVDESLFGEAVVRELVDLGGKRIGLGDFRPARRGPFGRFKVVGWKKS
jgi:hypothetical protein